MSAEKFVHSHSLQHRDEFRYSVCRARHGMASRMAMHRAMCRMYGTNSQTKQSTNYLRKFFDAGNNLQIAVMCFLCLFIRQKAENPK